MISPMDKYRSFCVDIYFFFMLKNSCLHNRLDKLAVLIDLQASGKCSQDQWSSGYISNVCLVFESICTNWEGKNHFFMDKLLTKTYCDEAGDYDMPNVLSQRDRGFKL